MCIEPPCSLQAAGKAERRALLAEVAEAEREAQEVGIPALLYAAASGKQRVVELLLQGGASIHEVPTPLLPEPPPPGATSQSWRVSIWIAGRRWGSHRPFRRGARGPQ